MLDMKHGLRPYAMAFAVAMELGLSGCGGGGGGNVRPTPTPTPSPSGGGFAGGNINVGAGDSKVLSDDISGSIDLIKGGGGTLVLTGTDTYTGGTTISSGILQLGNGSTTGSITDDVTDNGILRFDRSDNVIFSGVVNGSGSLEQAGKGTLTLTGTDTYTGGTTISSGILQLGNGSTTGSITGNVTDNGSLAFNRSDNIVFNGIVSGSGSLVKAANGALTLSGANSYTGTTQVNAGGLYVDGNQSSATGTTTVANGATLGGMGSIGGDVSLAGGATLAPGSAGAIGTLTINGNLDLSSGSILDYTFGQADTVGGALNDLTIVNGNLVLDGTINVSVAAGGSFGPGSYRVFNYSGALTDNGLTLGNIPSSGVQVQTGVAQQINLVVSAPNVSLGFWDGDAGPKDNNAVDGGSGTWESGSALTSNNWTDASGAVNTSFTDGSFAVFQAVPGTVTVSDGNGAVNVAGMQFASDGYMVQGDTIHLVGSTDDPTSSIIRVGDGTSAGAGYTATVGSALAGDSTLVKTDFGTLVLTGANTYTGGTKINSGTLQIGNGGTAGSITGDVADNGTLVLDHGDNVSFNGIVSGNGSLEQAGPGTLTLTADNTYTGGTTIDAGTLQLGNGGTTGSIVGDVTDNGTLVFDQSDYGTYQGDVTFSGVVSGSGSLVQAGTDLLTLTADNTYTGGTTISAGILQLGTFGTTGWITGDVTDNGKLVFERSDDVMFNGIVSGSGSLVQDGYGTLTLTAASTYTGGTDVNSGTLEIPVGARPGTGSVTVDGGTAKLQIDSGVSFSNVVILNGGALDNVGVLSNTTGETPVQFQSGSAGGSTLLNHDGGVIKGATLAVDLDGVPTVTNDGIGSTISSPGGVAIQLERGGTVVNNSGGVISGSSMAINLPAGGAVTNGVGSTIEVTGSGGYSIFVPASSQGSLRLTNDGTIVGNVEGGAAAGANATLSAGSVIQGNLDLGASGRLTLTGAGTTQLFSQAVTGTATFGSGLTKSGDGTWIIDTNNFQMSSTANFTTSISGGTLQVGTGGTTGSISQGGVDITGNGTLVFDHSDDVTFAGHIDAIAYGSGTGVLEQAGTGTLTLTSSEIAPDVIKIDEGTLQIGNGGTGPAQISSNIVDNGSLVINASGNLFIPYGITGTGSLTKQGTGTLFLTAINTGTGLEPSTYTGGTSVEGGILQGGKPIPGDVSVGTAGTLDVSHGANGDISPGVGGSLSNAGTVIIHGGDTPVGGNYDQSSTGTLAVSLGSKLAVAGTATLNGGTLEVTGADSGYVSNTHTDVLTAAGGVTGTFTNLVKDSGVVFTSTTINYDANSVWLDTTGLNVTTAAAGNGVSYTPASMSGALRVQGAFQQLDARAATANLSGVSSDFLSAAGQFQQAPTLQAAQASLQSLSGQLLATSAAMTFEAIDASSRALSDRFDNLLDKGAGFGMWTHDLSIGGDMARAGFDGVGFQLNGWLVGSDRRVGRSGVTGYAFGQSRGQQRLDQSFDHDNSHSTEGMLYAGWLNGNWYTLGRVGFGHYRRDVSRQILLGNSVQGVGTQYNGSYDVIYGESGLHFDTDHSHVIPFVNMQYARIGRDGFAEQGAGGFGLRSNAQILDRWQAGLGVRADHHWNLAGGRAVDISARAQWQSTLASHGDVFDASFVGLQQWQPLTGVGLSRYSGLFGVGLHATLSAQASLTFNYDYEMGQRDNAQTLSAYLNVAF